jgi:hypothetical protein
MTFTLPPSEVPARAPYPVQHICPALHCDALEHRQHGEGEVVEVGDAVLGPIPPGLAYCSVLTLPPVACLQSTRGRVLFCWDISMSRERKTRMQKGGRGDRQSKKKKS